MKLHTGCLKKFAITGNSTMLVRHLVVFFRVSDNMENNLARIVLFKSTIKLHNFSSDKKHNRGIGK